MNHPVIECTCMMEGHTCIPGLLSHLSSVQYLPIHCDTISTIYLLCLQLKLQQGAITSTM